MSVTIALFINFFISENFDTESYMLNSLTHIRFDRCHISLAVVTSVKYEHDIELYWMILEH